MKAARGSNGYVPNAGAIIGVPPKQSVSNRIFLKETKKYINFFSNLYIPKHGKIL